jgi:hypothetical protein
MILVFNIKKENGVSRGKVGLRRAGGRSQIKVRVFLSTDNLIDTNLPLGQFPLR